MDTIYTETTGTTCYINGERGIVTAIQRELRGSTTPRKVAAFVKLDERPAMLYVTLGNATGDRGTWHEVTTSREIDLAEFDRINGIDTLRREMGWAA